MENNSFKHKGSERHRASGDYFACTLTVQRSREREKADRRTGVQHRSRGKTEHN